MVIMNSKPNALGNSNEVYNVVSTGVSTSAYLSKQTASTTKKNNLTSSSNLLNTNTGKNKDQNYRFGEKYFAGQNVKIFFGDVYVDEINSINFSLNEQVAPIYGYASYTWDAVARGTRLIEGSFSINFTESSYLFLTLNELTKNLRQNITKGEKETQDNSIFDFETMQDNVTLEQILNDKDKYFEKTSNYEQALWGGQSSDYNYMSRNNKRTKDTHFYPAFINADKTVSGEETVYYDSSQKELREHGFNIMIAYGGIDQNCFGDGSTVHTLMNVQLTGVQQVIDGSGNPIEEVYTFIARDIDGKMTARY